MENNIVFRNKEGKTVEYSREKVADMVARQTADAKPMSMSDHAEHKKEADKHGYFRVE